MIQILKTIYAVFSSISQAKVAANLARAGKWQEAQALYKS